MAPHRRLDLLSIVKRKDALGLLAHSDSEERSPAAHSEALALIQIALGGMVAEEMMYGEISGTGPAGDLANATTVAAEIVGSLGLGGSLICLAALDDGPLGDPTWSARSSPTTGPRRGRRPAPSRRRWRANC